MAKRKPKLLSDQVRWAIETCGETRYRIGKETGISPAALCRFLQRKHGLSMSTLDILAEYLGLTIVVEKKPKKRKGR